MSVPFALSISALILHAFQGPCSAGPACGASTAHRAFFSAPRVQGGADSTHTSVNSSPCWRRLRSQLILFLRVWPINSSPFWRRACLRRWFCASRVLTPPPRHKVDVLHLAVDVAVVQLVVLTHTQTPQHRHNTHAHI
jgi:hypothetical protein